MACRHTFPVVPFPISFTASARETRTCSESSRSGFRLTSPAQNPYGSEKYGSRYQGQRGPTASRSFQSFHRTKI